MKGGIT